MSKRRLFYAALLLIGLAASALLLDHLLPPDISRAARHSSLVVDHDGVLLRGFTTEDHIWRLPLQPQQVDPLFLDMLLAYEDKRFYQHFGVDPLALVRALGQWLWHGRIVSGASTLTMQTARLLEPRPRTLAGKLREMLRALQLEWHYDKQQILSWYLTLAPYGGNLEGLRAASLAYLGKEPKRLTAAEAALLVVLPQSPSTLRPDRYPDKAQAARSKILQRMLLLGVLSERQQREAEQEKIPLQRQAMPMHAPHLARQLHATAPKQAIHQTTLHYNLQRLLEALAQRELNRLDKSANLALLVADNRQRRVLAYVASADFFASARAGQIDLIRAIRSPGSTLKPIIYGLGFEDLIIHPETLINDVPTRFGDYRPSNFRNNYMGQVSVREALQHSLNIPAVAILEKVGPGRMAARLRQANITLHWNNTQQTPGLPLALGGVGTSLWDLVTLYTALANRGRVAPLHYLPAKPDTSADNDDNVLLSPTASWYLQKILIDAPPPESQVPLANRLKYRNIAHKTGTSYGFRDAWAVGFDDDYTVGVWVGRPDGSPSPGHYGRNTAAPLLFRVFDLLPEKPHTTPVAPAPEGVILAQHNELPPRLQYFQTQSDSQRVAATKPLTITFPLDGSTVALSVDKALSAGNRGYEDLPLIASGGRKPLRWLVNGRPLSSSALRRQAFWRPDGDGFTEVTVIDKEGSSASASVWIQFE